MSDEPIRIDQLRHDLTGEWGELRYCQRCGGAEATLTTHCPGGDEYRGAGPSRADAVQHGAIDFLFGAWRKPALEVSRRRDGTPCFNPTTGKPIMVSKFKVRS